MLAYVITELILVVMLGMFVAVVRWAAREGDGDDQRWGVAGFTASESAIEEMGAKVFAVPTTRGLLLRSSPRQEAEWNVSIGGAMSTPMSHAGAYAWTDRSA